MDGFPNIQSPSAMQRNILAIAERSLQDDDLLELKSRWNDSLPIFRLPPEILLEIFETLAACASLAPRHCFEDRKNPYTWIRCTHVCRYWRNIALAAPSLWRRVTPACDECMKTMVERAGVHIALSIRLEHEPWLSTEPVQPEVSEDTYKLFFYQWLMRLPIETLEMPARADFPRSFYIAPQLQTLVINGSFIEEQELDPFGWEEPLFCLEGLPKLRELIVRFGSPRNVWTLFRRTLEVLDVHRMEDPQTVSKWFSALAEMPNLRKLRLVEVIAGIDPADPVELITTTPLLQLDHLHLEDPRSGATILQLLDHITIQAVHNLTLEVTMVEDVELAVNEEQIARLVRAMNTRRDSKAPFTLTVKTLEFQEHARIMIEIHAMPSKPKAEADALKSPSSPAPYDQSLILTVDPARVVAFTLSVLRELPVKIMVKLTIDVHFDANLLRPYFESTKFPWLRVLEPLGKTAETILELLAPQQIPTPPTPASTPVDSTESNAAAPPTTVLFPALLVLHWIDVTWKHETIKEGQPTLFDRLITTLQRRRSCTRKILTRISIYGSPELTNEDVARLRSTELARTTEWSGWEDTEYHNTSERWRLREILKDTRKEGMMLELQARSLRMIKEARELLQDDEDDEDWDVDDDTDEEENFLVGVEDEDEDLDEEEDAEDEDEDEDEEEGFEDESELEDGELALGIIEHGGSEEEDRGEMSSSDEGEGQGGDDALHSEDELHSDTADDVVEVPASEDEGEGEGTSGSGGEGEEGVSVNGDVSESASVSGGEEDSVSVNEDDSEGPPGSGEEDEDSGPPSSGDENEGASESGEEDEASANDESEAESSGGDEMSDPYDSYSSD